MQIKVLVVLEVVVLRDFLIMYFQRKIEADCADCKVVFISAPSYEKAWEWIRNGDEYHLLITNVGKHHAKAGTRMSGLDLLIMIRETGPSPQMPVLVTSGNLDFKHVCQSLGAFFHGVGSDFSDLRSLVSQLAKPSTAGPQ